MAFHRVIQDRLQTWGLEYLQTLAGKPNPAVNTFKLYLENYQFEEKYPDERYIWTACILALRATSQGNFGVGAIITNARGEMVSWGHNEVFFPCFASNKHAEMVAMDYFESSFKNTAGIRTHRLYTSVECCPMCLVRLIQSGIGTVIFAAPDPPGGMGRRIRELPQAWADLSKRQTFRQADCNPVLIDIARQIFEYDIAARYQKLADRP
jgi:tRNA(Arg) A34 adenosine deaminase TadA